MFENPFTVHKSVLCLWQAAVIPLVLASCTGVSFHPAPVVPTKHRLHYSAQVRLVELGVFAVEPGATMRTDPQLQNFVTHTTSVPNLSQNQWEKAVLDYVIARQTFQRVIGDGVADLALAVRISIYIDPGLSIDFNHVYITRADVTLTHPQTGRVIDGYSGFGKAFGPVSRSSKEEDEGPINKSVQAALNDVFSKLEADNRLRPL